MQVLANPLAPVECTAVNMPGQKEGAKLVMSQRDALEFSQLGLVKVNKKKIEWKPVEEAETQQEEVTDGSDA